MGGIIIILVIVLIIVLVNNSELKNDIGTFKGNKNVLKEKMEGLKNKIFILENKDNSKEEALLKELKDNIELHKNELLYLDHGFDSEADSLIPNKNLEQFKAMKKDARDLVKDGEVFQYGQGDTSKINHKNLAKIGRLVSYDIQKSIKEVSKDCNGEEAKAKMQIEFDRIQKSIPYAFKISDVYKAIAFYIVGYVADENEVKRNNREIEKEEARRKKEVEAFEAKKIEVEEVVHRLEEIGDGDSDIVRELKAKINELTGKIKKRKGPIGKEGWIYLVSDPRHEGTYKIGLTRRQDGMERVLELSTSAGIPFRMNLHSLFKVTDAFDTEGKCHKFFAKYIVATKKEWFKVSLVEIQKYLKTLGYEPDITFDIVHEKFEMSKARLAKINIEI